MEQTLINRITLAKRWDFESPNTLINYENDGILTRNPNFKVPRYYVDEILKIESLGNINPLSPLERRRLDKRILDLEKELNFYKEKFNNAKMLFG